LNFPNQRDLLVLAKLNHRLLTFVVLCVIGVALLSGRGLGLRQWSERFYPRATVRLPARDAAPVPSKRILFLVTSQEDFSDLRQCPAGAVEIAAEFAAAPRPCRTPFEFPAVLFAKPRAYILQSALNL